MEYSIVINDTVVNRIVCDEQFALDYAMANNVEMTPDPTAVIGSVRINGVFVKEEEPNGD